MEFRARRFAIWQRQRRRYSALRNKREGAGPEDFEGDCVAGYDLVGDFAGLTREDLAAFFEGFGHLGSAAAQALRVNAVGELLQDGVGREEVQSVAGVAVLIAFR